MVRIATYEAKELYTPTDLPKPSGEAYASVGRGVEQLGQSLGNAAQVFHAEQEKQYNEEENNATQEANAAAERAEQAGVEHDRTSPDGKGRTETVLKTYNDNVEKLYTTVSPEVRKRLQPKIDLQRERISRRSSNTEWENGNKYDTDRINTNAAAKTAQVQQDPSTFDEQLAAGHDEIEKSKMTAMQKIEAHRNFEKAMRTGLGEGVKKTDPETAQFMFGSPDRDGRYHHMATRIVDNGLIHQESGGNRKAVSPKGALGLTQVMPDTALAIARERRTPQDLAFISMTPYARKIAMENAEYNKGMGIYYLEKQLHRYGGNIQMALAAYNAGPGRVDSAIKKAAAAGKPDSWLSYMPAETRNYVPSIMAKLGNEKYLDSGSQQKPAQIIDGDISSVHIQAVELPDGRYVTASDIVGGKQVSKEDLANLVQGGIVPPLGEYKTMEEANRAASSDTPAIAPDSGDDAKPFVSPALGGLPAATIEQWDTDVKAAKTERNRVIEQEKANAKQNVEDDIAADIESMVRTGAPKVPVAETADFERRILETQGEQGQVKLEKWRKDRKVAQDAYNATKPVPNMTTEQLIENNRKAHEDIKTKEDEKVAAAIDAATQRELNLRKDDPGEAILAVPEVRKMWDNLDQNNGQQVQDYLRLVERYQRHLGYYNSVVPQLLPKTTIMRMVDQFRYELTKPGNNPATVTKQALQAFRDGGHYGEFADEIFTQVAAASYDSRISQDVRLVVAATTMKWVDAQPAHYDPRQKGTAKEHPEVRPGHAGQNAARWASELAAADKQLSEETKNDRSIYQSIKEWFTGPTVTEDEEGNPIDVEREKVEPEKSVAPEGNGNSSLVAGVDDNETEWALEYWDDPGVQIDFEKRFGEKAFREIEALKKERDKEKEKKKEPAQ